MSSDMYTILALFARYFFAGLMILIVLRAWRITVRDNRRARELRELAPQTGCVGQLLVSAQSKRPQVLPIPREGVLGSGRKADIRLRYKDVLPMHAHIEEREGGLLIKPLGKARLALGEGAVTGEQLFAKDGDTLWIGKHALMIVLFEPDAASEPDKPAPPSPTPSDHSQTEAEDPFRMPDPDFDEFFDEDKLWQSKPK